MTIWHGKGEKPSPFEWIVFNKDKVDFSDSYGFVHLPGADNFYYKNSPFEKWCYLSELLALEQENKELQSNLSEKQLACDNFKKSISVALKREKVLTQRIEQLEKALKCIKVNLKNLDLDTRMDEPSYSIWSHESYSLSMEIIDEVLEQKGGAE